jgi:hypothetical protein
VLFSEYLKTSIMLVFCANRCGTAFAYPFTWSLIVPFNKPSLSPKRPFTSRIVLVLRVLKLSIRRAYTVTTLLFLIIYLITYLTSQT